MDDNRPAPPTRGSLTIWGRVLLILLFLNGLGSVVGGIAVMREMLPFPEVWLQGTPFRSYFLPGLILCVAVGGSHLAGAFVVFSRGAQARTASVFAGLVLTGWMIGEIKLIGLQAPIQAWFVGVGLLEIALSFTRLYRSSS